MNTAQSDDAEPLPLFTASWKAARDAGPDVIAVRISLGTPKFWPEARDLPYVKELAPAGLMDVPRPEFDARYLLRLEQIGIEPVFATLREIHETYGKPMLLCCFERDRKDCHRSLAANWIESHTGHRVPEWGGPR